MRKLKEKLNYENAPYSFIWTFPFLFHISLISPNIKILSSYKNKNLTL